MSTAILASSNDVLPFPPPKFRPLETEAGNCCAPIAPAECGIPNVTSCEAGEAATLSQREGFAEEKCPTENVLRPNGILVVEDNWLLRKSLGQGFRDRGFDLWSAANGAEGVELYLQFSPLIDIVLSDVQMPALDGLGMLDALREINPSVRFCFMTGDMRAATLSRLLKRCPLRIFEKPLPSVASVAQELWELAAAPYEAIGISEANADAPPPNFVGDGVSVRGTPEEPYVFSWICSPLLTSISRLGSMLGKPRMSQSRVVPPG